MTLKIIGAGFGRTGTMSTYAALNKLGFPCYHMVEAIRNKDNASHLDFWLRVANAPPGTPQDWQQVYARYTAAVDFPTSCVWRELMQAYPEAKVLLTVHPKGSAAWYESALDTIYFTENRWQFGVLKLFTSFGRKFGTMSRKLIWQRSLKGTMNDRPRALAQYDAHIEDVKRSVPPEKLLVFSVDQGWEPLCKFLGVPVPAEPFPSVNDRADFRKLIAGVSIGAYLILGTLALSMIGLIAVLMALLL